MSESMKALTVRLTPAVHSALTEAVLICNRAEKEACVAERTRYDFITQEEYVEELVMVRLAELGLIKKYAKRK